ncbi:cytochrome P450 [Streptomyces griseorubiginosus]|uniref:cytochrome P450 n=1 Tax=Streptomyces griseorubiginosus TaxID=67304 RepID=UPI002E80F196|nr:cytochrome P450 [Streptomyces griseorubiginosus]WUB48315.1 cytochrome P450 [Streptomyces griseorubiginosus]WUB56840.1 cytochrome P450 [Streptomyces griseorubiginosus]
MATNHGGITRAPGGLPIIGHLFPLLRDPLRFLNTLPAHGDLVQIKLGPQTAVVVCRPELVQEVLLNDRIYDKGGPIIERVGNALGDGIASCPHSAHRRQRRSLQPAFSRTCLRKYAGIMTDRIDALATGWSDGETIEVGTQMYALASDTIARTLFKAEAAAPAVDAVTTSLPDIFRGIYQQAVLPPLLRSLPLAPNKRYERARNRAWAAVSKTISLYRQGGEAHGDVLSMLLRTRDDEGAPLDDREIHAQIMTLLVAGIDTTAVALTWAVHLLCQHPDVQERLRAETAEVLGARTATWEDLPRLDMARRVITETLRLYPPGWIFTRTTTTEARLADAVVPSGTTLVYSPYLLHHDARFNPRPDSFDPDRWLPEREQVRGALIPFGGGARKCLGDNYAMTLATLALATIVTRWRLSHGDSRVPSVEPRMTLSPRRVEVRVESLESEHVTQSVRP